MVKIWSDGDRTRVFIDGVDVSDSVLSVEWDHDANDTPVARLVVYQPRLEAVTKLLVIEVDE